MVSTMSVKSGGVWRGPVADGIVSVKSNGVWVAASAIYAKKGGAWVNTGYTGYPNQPSTVWVQQWDYANTLTGFNGPSGGPAIDFYHIERLDANGTPVEGYYDTSGSRWWGTPQDTRHQFRVRSHGANGLFSDWSGPYLHVGIGHPETYNYGYVQRTRGWQTGGSIGYEGYFNNLAGFAVPSSVLVTAVHWQLWSTDGIPISVWPPAYVSGGNRHVNIHLNESYIWERPNWPANLDGWDGVNYPGGLIYWGNGGRTGFVCRNINEDGGPDNPWAGVRVDGYVTISGTEYYDNYEVVSTNPGQGNYYW